MNFDALEKEYQQSIAKQPPAPPGNSAFDDLEAEYQSMQAIPQDQGSALTKAQRYADEPYGSFRAAKSPEQQASDRWYTDLYMESQQGLEDPWLDPTMAATAGYGAGAKVGMGAGTGIVKGAAKALFPALAPKAAAKGLATAAPATLMEYPIGALANMVDTDENEALAFMTAIGTGLASGFFVEPAMERKIRTLAGHIVRKYPGNAAIRKTFEKLGFGQTPTEKAQDAFSRMKGGQPGAEQPAEELAPDRPFIDSSMPQPRPAPSPGPATLPGGPRTAPVRTTAPDQGITIADVINTPNQPMGRLEPAPIPAQMPDPQMVRSAEQAGQVFQQAAAADEVLRRSPQGADLLRQQLAQQQQPPVTPTVPPGGTRIAPTRTQVETGITIDDVINNPNPNIGDGVTPSPLPTQMPEPRRVPIAKNSADALEQEFQRLQKVRQSPQGAEGLRQQLAGEESQALARSVDQARRFAQEQPEMVGQMGKLHQAGQVSPQKVADVTRQAKLSEVNQRYNQPIKEMTDQRLQREAAALRFENRQDLAALLDDELSLRKAAAQTPQPQKQSKGETLRYQIDQMGGINTGNFKGETKDLPPIIRRSIIRKNGLPIDVAERQLKDEGWLDENEDLLELLRTDPKALRRRHPGTAIKDRKRYLTEDEQRLKDELDFEPEPPDDPRFDDLPAKLQEDVAYGRIDIDEAVKKSSVASQGATVPFSMAGGAAGIEQDEEGNITWDAKKGLAGALLGLAGVKSFQKLYAGLRAKGKDLPAIKKAADMEIAGADQKEIRDKTGWFRGLDGMYRFEISDNKARFSMDDEVYRSGDLSEMLDHPALYANYPDAANIQTTVLIDPINHRQPKGQFVDGVPDTNEYFGRSPEIKVYAPDEKSAKETILHEVQHYIQTKESFATGGSPGQMRQQGDTDQEAFDKYRRLAGEIEARDVAARANYDEYGRKVEEPYYTQSEAKDPIVRFDTDEMALDSSISKPNKDKAVEYQKGKVITSSEQGNVAFSMAGGAAGFEEDKDGNLVFDPKKAIIGIVASAVGATAISKIGISSRVKSGKGKGRYLRGGKAKPKDYKPAVRKALSDDIVKTEWDQVESIDEAIEMADNMTYLDPIVTSERRTKRWGKKTAKNYEELLPVVGNDKMAQPNESFPQGRNTYDFQGCGRAAWAEQNGIDVSQACYGGACYAEAIGKSKGRGSIASGELYTTNVPTSIREKAQTIFEKDGLDAARQAYPDYAINKYENNPRLAIKKRAQDPGNAAIVTTNLQSAAGQDIRLGVDTDGSAWLSNVKVMDALVEADPRTLTVYSSAYHKPPPKHPLSDKTIINVTISGWHPLPETMSRLRWAKEARDNGWNVILREVVANPKQFAADEVDLYNRVHDAVMATDFFVQQQPLHKGATHGSRVFPKEYGKDKWQLPGCCRGTTKNPHTCDQCEVAEGLGKGFQAHWGIGEEAGKKAETVLPGSEYKGLQKTELRTKWAKEKAKYASGDMPASSASATKLMVHPSTITGPIGGLGYGIDWKEFEENGNIKIDPKKALIGAMAGAAAPPAKRLGVAIANKWDKDFAKPFIDWARKTTNGLIVNEAVRQGLGLNRSSEMKDLLRNHRRDIERAWNKAAEIGQELAKIAPTQLEQRRLMQVVRGGITASDEMRKKADKVRKKFDELREELQEFELLEYSRFDKLTRKERAKLRKIIEKDKTLKKIEEQAFRRAHGISRDPGPKTFDPTKDNIDSYATETIPIDAYTDKPKSSAEWAREKLHDYYHFGSAKEYAPIFYREHEGLTPKQKQVLEDEIRKLKIKSRRGNPEGNARMEAMIAELEQMLGKGAKARRQMKATRKKLNKRYSHRRIEMPPEVQAILGKIEEAPFPVAKMLGIQKTDVHKQKLFKEIAKRSEWALPTRMKHPRTGEMVKVHHDPPANFIKVEDERFGALDQMYVRKDIWEDLKEVEDMRDSFVKGWDKMMGAWKYGKVVLNPATHMRNAMSNMILAYLAGVNPGDVKTYAKASKAVMAGEKNKYYKEAADWGLYNNTFVTSEITKLRDELDHLRDGKTLQKWIRKAVSLPAEVYQGNEKLFKTAVFIKAREEGKSVDEAARKAEKYLFNYADIPPFVKHMKRWVSPFFTFTYKAIPLFAEMAIRKPWKIAAIGGAMYGMERYSRYKLGISDEEANQQRRLLPEWQQRKTLGIGPYNHVLMPFRDKWGNELYLDTSYILPYGNLGEKWGQSALPLSDLLPSNPAFSLASAIMTNKDAFTGREIYNKVLDSASQITAKYLDYAWKEVSPSLAPGGHGFNKIKTGVQNTFMGKDVRDWADRPVEFTTAVLSSLGGIKLSPANQRKLEQFEIQTRKNINREIYKEIGRLRGKLRRNEITRKEFNEQVKALNKLKADLQKGRPKI